MSLKRPYGDWRKGKEVQQRAMALAAARRALNANEAGIPQRMIVRPRPFPLNVPQETKYFDSLRKDYTVISMATTTTGLEADPATLQTLFAPTQGDDITQRDGRSCYVTKITIKGSLTSQPSTAATAANTSQGVRLILCIDKQTNSAQMNSEDLIFSSVADPATFDFQNKAFFGRFRILKDKMLSLPTQPIASNGTAAQLFIGSTVKYFKIRHKFAVPLKINFNGTNGGTVADIIDNSLHLIVGQEKVAPTVLLSYQCRTVFKG